MLTGLSLPQRLARAVRRTCASRCRAVIALALVPLVASLLTVTRAEANETLAPVTTTIFLADPKLGIAGAIQSGDSIMYFEVITPAGSTEMSTRLLDAAGRTIAVSGHSMDSKWLSDTSYDSVAAAKSLSIAAKLSSGLATALDQSVFGREAAHLSGIAISASRSTPGTAALRDNSISGDSISGDSISGDSVKGHSISGDSISGDSISGDSIGSDARAYDIADAARVAAGRDSLGNLTAIYLGASVSTFAASTTGGSEISVEIASTSGAPVAYLFGGNNVPNAWNAKAFPAHPSAITDPVEYYKGVGTAVRGALLLARYSPVATTAEASAITRIAADLRNRLLPVPTSDAATATAPAIYTSTSRGGLSTRFRIPCV
jgi:hypothetical protein